MVPEGRLAQKRQDRVAKRGRKYEQQGGICTISLCRRSRLRPRLRRAASAGRGPRARRGGRASRRPRRCPRAPRSRVAGAGPRHSLERLRVLACCRSAYPRPFTPRHTSDFEHRAPERRRASVVLSALARSRFDSPPRRSGVSRGNRRGLVISAPAGPQRETPRRARGRQTIVQADRIRPARLSLRARVTIASCRRSGSRPSAFPPLPPRSP